MVKDNAKMRTAALPGVLADPVLNRGVAFSAAEEILGIGDWGVGGIQIAVGKPDLVDLSRGGVADEAADGILAAARFRDATRAHRLVSACGGLAWVLPKSPGPAFGPVRM